MSKSAQYLTSYVTTVIIIKAISRSLCYGRSIQALLVFLILSVSSVTTGTALHKLRGATFNPTIVIFHSPILLFHEQTISLSPLHISSICSSSILLSSTFSFFPRRLQSLLTKTQAQTRGLQGNHRAQVPQVQNRPILVVFSLNSQ